MRIYKIIGVLVIIFVVIAVIFISRNYNKNQQIESGIIFLDSNIINPNYIQGSSIDLKEGGMNVSGFQGANSNLQGTSNLFINSTDLNIK
jgi:hypothetical protein